MRTALLSLCTLAMLVGTARAQDTWSDPFPGVRHLHRRTANQNINVLVVDLCAAGVSMRTTGGGERGRVASDFGALVGAQAVVNGDFYSSGYNTDGLAVHAGQQWSGSDHTYVGPLAFGQKRVELRPHEDQAGLEPWMQEVVSGHPTILWDGQPRNNNGDPLCSNRHPRTAAGLSADRRTLVLAVVDGREAPSRIGMTCDELSALMREMGADDAMNLDGGGSSTMWMQGAGVLNYPSDGSQRVTANHLAVYARGSGDPTHCPNRAPHGYLDGATCEAVAGWAQDPDRPDQAIGVHVYFDGGPGDPEALAIATTADREREDLCTAIGSCAHGYSLPVPAALRDGEVHPVQVFGIDADGGENPVLTGGPMEVRCDPLPLPRSPEAGLLRHVTSAESLTAWGQHFYDVARHPAETVAAYAEGPALPSAPRLVRAAGADAVYVIDGELRRHITGPEVMEAWHFDWAAIEEISAEELDTFATGAPLPAEPFLVQGDGPEVYLLDVADPADPESPGVDVGPDPDLAGGCAAADGVETAGVLLLLAAALWLLRRQR